MSEEKPVSAEEPSVTSSAGPKSEIISGGTSVPGPETKTSTPLRKKDPPVCKHKPANTKKTVAEKTVKKSQMAGAKSPPSRSGENASKTKQPSRVPDTNLTLQAQIQNLAYNMMTLETKISALPNQIVTPTLETIHSYISPVLDEISKLNSLPNLIVTPTLEAAHSYINPIYGEINKLPNQIVTPTLEAVHSYINPVYDEINNLPNLIVDPTLEAVHTYLKPVYETLNRTEQRIIDIVTPDFRKALFEEACNAVQSEAGSLLLPIQNVLNDVAGRVADDMAGLQLSIIEQASDGPHATLEGQNWLGHIFNRRPKVVDVLTQEDALADLQARYSERYRDWKKCFDAGGKIYIKSPKNNCAHWSERRAWAFKSYIRRHASGNILDIGCGPYGDPLYLRGIDARWLTGIEPLKMQTATRFPVHIGFNEKLPFGNEAFDTVVNSTAIDHCIDLPDSIAETARIIKPDGRFVIWYANVEGAEDPTRPYKGALDQFHLFHPNDEWFMPMMEKHFRILDRKAIWAGGGVHDVFAVFEPLK